MLSDKYDVVLAAETLYYPHAHASLLSLIKAILAPQGAVSAQMLLCFFSVLVVVLRAGIVLNLFCLGFTFVASKTFYFGTGGGTAAFAECVRLDGALEVALLKRFEDGAAISRDVLRLSWKQQ